MEVLARFAQKMLKGPLLLVKWPKIGYSCFRINNDILLETYISLTGPNNNTVGNRVSKHGPNNYPLLWSKYYA